MLKEIHEQPDAVGETMARNLRDGVLDLERIGGLDLADVRRVVIVACGTAYHAGLVGGYLIEEWAGLPCDVEIASEWRYRRPLIEAGTLVVGISQSGETADTLARPASGAPVRRSDAGDHELARLADHARGRRRRSTPRRASRSASQRPRRSRPSSR